MYKYEAEELPITNFKGIVESEVGGAYWPRELLIFFLRTIALAIDKNNSVIYWFISPCFNTHKPINNRKAQSYE